MDTSQLAGPLILAPLMFVVGLQLTVDDFRRVLSEPKAAIGGTLGQILLLPLMTLALLQLFQVSPTLAVGALLLAASPGGGSSNVVSALSNANVALSVTLTAVASILSVITLPAITALGMPFFLDGGLEVEVPVLLIVIQLSAFLAVPIGLGMLVNARFPEATARYVKNANRFALIAILLLTVLGAISSGGKLPKGSELGFTVLIAIAWTFCAAAIGYLLGLILRLSANDRFTFVIEFGARNAALTIIVALTAMDSFDLALFPAIYIMTGGPLVLLFALVRGKLVKNKSDQ